MLLGKRVRMRYRGVKAAFARARWALLGVVISCSPDLDVYPLAPLPADSLAGRHRSFDERRRLVFLVFGDSGLDTAQQREVAAQMHVVCQQRGCDFAIGLGDNVYSAGIEGVTDDDIVETFEQPFAAFGHVE